METKTKREYSLLYAPQGELADATVLDQALAERFMRVSKMKAIIAITDRASLDLHNLDKSLEQVFGTPQGTGISIFTKKSAISQTPEWLLAKGRMDPYLYNIYLLNEHAPLITLNQSIKSALGRVLLSEKFAFLPRTTSYDMGGFEMKSYAGPPSVEPLNYLKGKIFLMRHGNHLILPKS